MSNIPFLKGATIIAVSTVAAVTAVVRISRPVVVERTGGGMDIYNQKMHPEQDRRDTIFDRTQIMNDVKNKKPWNMTYAEKERVKHDS